jgi:hypothetical protein
MKESLSVLDTQPMVGNLEVIVDEELRVHEGQIRDMERRLTLAHCVMSDHNDAPYKIPSALGVVERTDQSSPIDQ